MAAVRIARYPLTILLLSLPLSVVAPQAQGQQERIGQDTTQAQPSPQVIPVAAIPQRSDAARSSLRALRERMERADAITLALEELPAFIDDLTSALEEPAFRPDEGASLRGLNASRRRWTPYQGRLAEWKRTLDPQAQRLAEERDSLLQGRRIWERTRGSVIEEGAQGALLNRVTSVLTEIDDTDARLRTNLDRVLSALDQINWGQGSISDLLTQINSAEALARARLFSQDKPPLWRAILAPGDTLSLAWEVRESWRETSQELSRYVRSSREEFVFAIGTFLFFLLLLYTLLRQGRAWGEQSQLPTTSAEFERTTRFLSRPISVAVLLTVLIGRLWHPLPSAQMGAVFTVALVVPVLRLLAVSTARDLRKPMYGLAVTWVLGEGTLFILDGSLLQRLTLLVTAALVGTGLFWVVRQESAIRASATNRWLRAALLAGHLGIFVMGASVVANVLGFTSLAELLTRATISSAVAAIVLATILTILESLIWTLLNSDWALRLRAIRNHSQKLTSRLLMLARVGLFFLWLGIGLREFGIQSAVLGALADTVRADLTLGTFAISLGDILAFAVVLWLSLILARGIQVLLEEDLLQSVNLPRGVPTAISTLVHYAALFIGFLMAAAAAGFDLSRFTLLAGAFGVGLGFGLQNVVNNFVSGLILIFERPIQVGDAVEVGAVQGKVRRIGIRASTVKTWSGAEVIVPNGDLISQQVTNWTLSDRLRRLEVAVGVRYGTDPQRVIDLLTATAGKHPDVLSHPEVTTVFQGFGQSSLDFTVRAWTSSDDWRIVNSDLAVAVNNALEEAKIEIPFPQRELHLRSVDPEAKLGV